MLLPGCRRAPVGVDAVVTEEMVEGLYNERIVSVVEFGRHVGYHVIKKVLDDDSFTKIRRHELTHAWIYKLLGIGSVPISVAIFPKRGGVESGGVTYVLGNVGFVKVYFSDVVQFIFDLYDTYLLNGISGVVGMFSIVFGDLFSRLRKKQSGNFSSDATVRDVTIRSLSFLGGRASVKGYVRTLIFKPVEW